MEDPAPCPREAASSRPAALCIASCAPGYEPGPISRDLAMMWPALRARSISIVCRALKWSQFCDACDGGERGGGEGAGEGGGGEDSGSEDGCEGGGEDKNIRCAFAFWPCGK